MSRSAKSAIVAAAVGAALTLLAVPVQAQKIGLGREALQNEIKAWDIDVRPDGHGLPPGKGTVAQGEALFVAQCAACHGEFGESAGRWPIISGGTGTLASHDPVK